MSDDSYAPTRVEDPPYMVTMFEAVGVPRLRQALDDGTVSTTVDGEELGRYCKVAAVRVAGVPIRVEGDDDLGMLLDHLGMLLATALSGDGPDYFEVDGEPYVWAGDGLSVKVTADVLRHWQWLWSILRDDRTARDLLAAAPAGLRQEAEQQAQTAFSLTFESIVAAFG